jgi:hypothetical protein
MGSSAGASSRSASSRGASSRRGIPSRSPSTKGSGAGTGEMYGEGNWKADEEYRQGLKDFSETHDTEELARTAADDLDDEDEEGSAPKKSTGKDDDSEW